MALATFAFKTEFAVDMTCQNCVNAVSESLKNVEGVERYDIDLENKQVTITGRTPPSQLLSALKATNRQVIVRGTSSSTNPNLPIQAAVAIMESPLPLPTSLASTSNPILAGLSGAAAAKPLPGMNEEEHTQKVFGICRFVQIAPKTVLMDLTVRLPPPARVGLGQATDSIFNVYIASTGNLVNPPSTTGKPFFSLGSITPDKNGYGDMFKEVDGELWEWIGRGCVVEAASNAAPTVAQQGVKDAAKVEHSTSTIGRLFAGVVARSAGAWGNDKTVCACSGRTMWEEGREMDQKKF
ncbi:copper chaperone [Cryptococcus wingfieldii CBS 7118]|uniref:Superoxide dismutase 1 copper chaperone n=1 Tax=Cryptococcus wingfieldii CBS 7118 TaxID=1295528 RepID=A0A1E3JL24_9TREE|nr:copper chaperone [Cryptococcus wingfieldii CBS 7118]ODO00827.1 copper chaperone [Cryptococcus wingfieldii CBS 7118]